jgi:hypothetical protein
MKNITPTADQVPAAIEKPKLRRRIALIAAERKLDPSETETLMKGRWLTLRNLGQFAEKHGLRIDWLIGGDLKWHPRGSSPSRHMANPRPRAMSDQEFVEALAVIDEKSRQFIIGYMQLLIDGGGAA